MPKDTLDDLLAKHGATKTFVAKDHVKSMPLTLACAAGKCGPKSDSVLVRAKWELQAEAIKEVFTLSQQEEYRARLLDENAFEILSLAFEELEGKVGQVGADIVDVQSSESMHARLKLMRHDEAQRQQ